MRLFRATYRDRKGRQRESARWYVEFSDHLGIIRRIPAFSDKAASEEFGRKVSRLASCMAAKLPPDAELARWIEGLDARTRERLLRFGLLDSQRAAGGKLLAEHLGDYERVMLAKGDCQRHVQQEVSKARRIMEGCRFRYWSDISASKVQGFLAELRKNEDIGARTFNSYLTAFKMFCKWCVQDGRASESPVQHLKPLNARTDVRRRRRALSPDELRRLIHAPELRQSS